MPAAWMTSVLPVCLVVWLHLSPLAYGVLAGLCVGVTATWRAVREHRDRPPGDAVPLSAVGGLVLDRRVRRLALAAAALGLATVGDGFVYLLLHHRGDLDLRWLPVLVLGTQLARLLLGAPVGALVARVGRLPAFLAGYLLLAATYGLLAGPLHGPLLVLAVLVLQGGCHATTQGLLTALAGSVLPAFLRTAGLSLARTSRTIGYVLSPLLFGLAWTQAGPTDALRLAAVVALAGLAGTAVLLREPRRARAGLGRGSDGLDEAADPGPAVEERELRLPRQGVLTFH